jgi:ribonuclease Z
METVALDHGIPSLAFALVEPVRVNVLQGALEAQGLPVGPWLAEAKRAARRGAPDETRIAVADGVTVALGALRETVLRLGPGQKVAYVTDAADTPENAARIVALARGADHLFIEAAFLEADRDVAARTRHLTAARAGALARAAGARHLTTFHHSARYLERPGAVEAEARAAFRGEGPTGAASDERT